MAAPEAAVGPRKRQHSVYSLSPATKRAWAETTRSGQGNRGGPGLAADLLKEIPGAPSERTVRSWRKGIREGTFHDSPIPRGHRPSLLSWNEKLILGGKVICAISIVFFD